MKKIFHTIFQKPWSPYFAGIFIGFLQIPTFLLIGKTLGASTAYGMFVDFLIRVTSSYNPEMSPAIANASRFCDIHNWWYVPLLIGVALGAFASSKLTRRSSLSTQKDDAIVNGWAFFGLQNKILQLSFSFLGGFFLLLGARIASGCASGHGLSGIAKLQTSSFITIISMFVFAIISVNIIFKIYKNFKGHSNE